MRFLDILRKLGIFRSGTLKYFGGSEKRGSEFIMNDVYDSKKDLIINKKIFKKEK